MTFLCSGPRAKVTDGRLVLSLPDAETPAVWIMNLTDASTAVIRLETDKQNFYVLKKHGGKGTGETVAVYRDRSRGVRALKCASNALERARGMSSGKTGFRWLRFTLWCLVVVFVLYMLGIDTIITHLLSSMFGVPEITASGTAEIPNVMPQNAPAPDGVPPAGVPMSADDFLNSSRMPPQF